MNGAPGPGVATGAVRIFDTTLRDGEQAPGAGLTVAEKLEVARQLTKLKVDVIEAGFPAASEGDFEAVRQIAESTKGIGIAALARCKLGQGFFQMFSGKIGPKYGHEDQFGVTNLPKEVI